MKRTLCCLLFLVSVCALARAQQPDAAKEKDIDPLALQVLQKAMEPIHQATSYSFRVLVSHEQLGTNGQVVTLFNTTEATVQKPDRLHIDFRRSGKEVELFFDGGDVVLYSPAAKLYTSIKAPKTIEATLDSLDQKAIFIPIRNFLDPDPYKSLADDVQTAYILGRVEILDQTVHQLAFTEPGAEWQLWVVGGDQPRILRLQVIDTSTPYKGRTTVQFLDWNFNPGVNPATFTFAKPSDAAEIGSLQQAKENAQ